MDFILFILICSFMYILYIIFFKKSDTETGSTETGGTETSSIGTSTKTDKTEGTIINIEIVSNNTQLGQPVRPWQPIEEPVINNDPMFTRI